MLRNWTNYLLGSLITDQEATARGVENTNLHLTSLEKEDGWVFVDKDIDSKSDTSSVGSMDECLEDTILLQPKIRTRTSSTSSLPCATNMEESWFITPPPCFTSTGPICMRTSPLENLLIEHPSMSVYHIHGRRSSVSSASQCSDDHEEFDMEEIENAMEQPRIITRVPRLSILQILHQQQRQVLLGRKAQKKQVQKKGQSVKRGKLDRNNKAREVNSRNRRQRRGERSQGATRSRANNNRKC